MGNTLIEWCNKVWNPITGCSPVSEGCQNCYARRMANRLKGRYGYPKDEPFKVTFHPERLDESLRWKKPSRIFVCSMGDLFHKNVAWYDINKIWNIAYTLKYHTFLLLTKRPENLKNWTLIKAEYTHWPKEEIWPDWMWLGVSVENQRTADERIPILLQTPAAKRFVSVEPILERIQLSHYIPSPVGLVPAWQTLNWVICGGETGPKARPMSLEWARSLRDQCRAAGVPFFFKQMSGKQPIPKDLMIREFPK